MYKDSVNILGVSIDELEEFVNPSSMHASEMMVDKKQQKASMRSSSQDQFYREHAAFISRLDKACELPDTLGGDIDAICNYCLRLIEEINA